ncbi:hypothetical protein TWF481_005506 [Arthrobotrys musiformis]|uniref:Uncharacterized protein n=1 Tax=Arthrobotrys musiformis TaxID=47236 RepID=A0AAV9WFZ5_9PEZI
MRVPWYAVADGLSDMRMQPIQDPSLSVLRLPDVPRITDISDEEPNIPSTVDPGVGEGNISTALENMTLETTPVGQSEGGSKDLSEMIVEEINNLSLNDDNGLKDGNGNSRTDASGKSSGRTPRFLEIMDRVNGIRCLGRIIRLCSALDELIGDDSIEKEVLEALKEIEGKNKSELVTMTPRERKLAPGCVCDNRDVAGCWWEASPFCSYREPSRSIQCIPCPLDKILGRTSSWKMN